MKNKKIIKRIMVIFLVFLFLFYGLGSHLVIQIALCPSFMEKLDAFQSFTDKGYGEQVYTEDIVQSMNENQSKLKEWLGSVKAAKAEITTEDDLTLIGTAFLQEEEGRPWILSLHGYTGWKEAMYPTAYYFYEQGYNVLCPDMRAHGSSEGKYIGLGYLDRLDNIKWIELILSVDPNAEIILYGQSMGGAAVIHLAKELNNREEIKSHVRCCIVDSAFCDPTELFTSKVKDWTGLPCFGLLKTADILMPLETGYSLQSAKAIDAVDDATLPFLFIQGMADKIVDPNNVDRLYSACQSEKEVLKIEGAGHTQSYEKDPETYFVTVFSFIQQYVS